MIGFSVDQNEIIINIEIRMGIPQFLNLVTEVYQYAVKYNGSANTETKELSKKSNSEKRLLG